MSNYEWAMVSESHLMNERVEVREHTTYSSSSVSWATSGTVIVPLTSSASFVEPALSQRHFHIVP